jgi:hypothetical protein
MKLTIHACECHKQWMPEAENYQSCAVQAEQRIIRSAWWIKLLGLAVVGAILVALATLDGLRTANRWLGRPVHFVRYRTGCLLRGDWSEAFRLPTRMRRIFR